MVAVQGEVVLSDLVRANWRQLPESAHHPVDPLPPLREVPLEARNAGSKSVDRDLADIPLITSFGDFVFSGALPGPRPATSTLQALRPLLLPVPLILAGVVQRRVSPCKKLVRICRNRAPRPPQALAPLSEERPPNGLAGRLVNFFT